jgi:hypothetical protein
MYKSLKNYRSKFNPKNTLPVIGVAIATLSLCDVQSCLLNCLAGHPD